MARRPREEMAGGVFHVFARGVVKQPIFVSDADRVRYLAGLARAVRRHAWHCLAYCLMDNHVHLLLETPRANLAAGMQRLHGDYAQAFNRLHGRSGHVFQGRYGSVSVRSEAQLWVVAGYIAANPVEAGACPEAELWRWGSYAATIGRAEPPPWLAGDRLLAHFAAWGGDPIERYRSAVDERAAMGAAR